MLTRGYKLILDAKAQAKSQPGRPTIQQQNKDELTGGRINSSIS